MADETVTEPVNTAAPEEQATTPAPEASAATPAPTPSPASMPKPHAPSPAAFAKKTPSAKPRALPRRLRQEDSVGQAARCRPGRRHRHLFRG